jgi:CRP/FNR family transcriptional regulator
MTGRCAHDPAGVVARQPLFASLSEAECRGLVARSVCRAFHRNELLFREGERCRGLYLVVEGRVRTYCANRNGHEQVLGIYGAGESLGEVSLFDEGPYLASARAAEASRLLFLPIGEVQALYETRPEVARAVVRELAGRVRELTALVDRLALQDVPTRVAAAVLRYAEENGHSFRLPRTQEELAAELGTSRESVARSLHDLRGAGVIRQRGARVELLDVAELRRLASRTGSASQRMRARGAQRPVVADGAALAAPSGA